MIVLRASAHKLHGFSLSTTHISHSRSSEYSRRRSCDCNWIAHCTGATITTTLSFTSEVFKGVADTSVDDGSESTTDNDDDHADDDVQVVSDDDDAEEVWADDF